MPDLQALIFDMDGVLIDNTAVQARAFQLLFRDQGVPADATPLLRRLNGAPASEILREAFAEKPQPADKLEELAGQREFLYRTLYWDDRRPLPGLVDFLAAARAAGLKIGLGTGSGQETIGYILDDLNLRRFFDVVVTKDDVDQGKPHADTYAVTAQKLGVDPAHCVVFEDALLGEQAASRAAGLKIGLGTGSGQETIGYILDDLNLRRFFDVVVTKDDVDQGKPHADTYAVTAQKLGVDPAHCVVFEDALLGEQAAYRAHMHCVAVTSTLPGRDFQAPLLVVRDFTELTPAGLRAAFEAVGPAPKPGKAAPKK